MTPAQWRAFVRKEIVLFIQYALIASLAASLAHDLLKMKDRWEVYPPVPIEGPPLDINLVGMINVWVGCFLIPWFQAFLPLALVRTIFVALAFWYRGRLARRTGGKVPSSEEFNFRRELWPLFSYSLISFVAVTYVLLYYIKDSWIDPFVCTDRYPRWLYPDAGVFEIASTLGERFYGPWFLTFAGLSVARFLGLWLVRRLAERHAVPPAS